MTDELPSFYNDLGLSLDAARMLIITGAQDRHSAAHVPIVATIDDHGAPSQRVMILRECDWENRRLRFHTDIRSDKVAQIGGNIAASVLIYDEAAKLQLRMTGTAQIVTGPGTQPAWQQSAPFARRCYMADRAPGGVSSVPTSGLPAWIEGIKPSEEQLAPARENLALLHVTFRRIDWLYLAHAGHRRAVFEWNDTADAWHGQWLVP